MPFGAGNGKPPVYQIMRLRLLVTAKDQATLAVSRKRLSQRQRSDAQHPCASLTPRFVCLALSQGGVYVISQSEHMLPTHLISYQC